MLETFLHVPPAALSVLRTVDTLSCLVFLADVLVRWRCEHVWHPVRAFGDTFGAHGALGLAWAVAALRRGYAPSPTAAVFSGDADGATAIWVQAMPAEVMRG